MFKKLLKKRVVVRMGNSNLLVVNQYLAKKRKSEGTKSDY